MALLKTLRPGATAAASRPAFGGCRSGPRRGGRYWRNGFEVSPATRPSDRLIVVAGNCTDATAEGARAAGAETNVRLDLQRRGKDYALDFGVRHLEGDPSDVVVIIDADCGLGHGAFDALVDFVARDGRAAQAFNAVVLPRDPDAKRRVAKFAWIVKNHVPPRRLAALGLPCQLMGTGLSIPWLAIRRIDLAVGNVVEDVKMGLDIAVAGHAPRY